MQHGDATPMQHASLKDKAFKVLERNNSVRQPATSSEKHVLHHPDSETPLLQHDVAGCPGPDKCAGCYSVGVLDGGERLIHPPKASAEWKSWLKKWEPKGRPQ